jgi:hypothetical protein
MKAPVPQSGALLFTLLWFWQLPLLAQNLLINGNFEAGNSGFTSDYTYSPGDISVKAAARIYEASGEPQVWEYYKALS